jgi:hypothetical protein
MTPDKSVQLAQSLLKQVEIPSGVRVVLISTDESGEFLGVTSNVPNDELLNILICAIQGHSNTISVETTSDLMNLVESVDPSKHN